MVEVHTTNRLSNWCAEGYGCARQVWRIIRLLILQGWVWIEEIKSSERMIMTRCRVVCGVWDLWNGWYASSRYLWDCELGFCPKSWSKVVKNEPRRHQISKKKWGVRPCKTYGKGVMSVVKPASSAVAPTVPSLLYMALANSGNAAAKEKRIATLLARAEAAIGR